MRLGISSYTFPWSAGVPGYPAPQTPLAALGLLDRAKRLGVRVVQIADNMAFDPLVIAAAHDAGITLELGTRGIEPVHLRYWLALCRQAGARLLRTLIDAGDERPDPATAVTRLRAVAGEFEQAGVLLAVENHDRFHAAVLREVIEEVDSPAVGICFDTANSFGCGEGTMEVVRMFRHRIVNVHIKDFTARRLAHNFGFLIEGAPAGRGLLDLQLLFQVLAESGCATNVILEHWPPFQDDLETTVCMEEKWAEESIANLRRYVSD